MDGTEYRTIRKAYKSMQDLVFETLRDEILTGKLKPGDSLNTLALSKRLDVSRTPIREALNRLVSIGLVENIPYKGSIVRKLSVDEIIEIYYIRAALAGICARLATSKLTEVQKERLSTLCDEMESLQASMNHNLMLEKNFEFHQIIIKAANSPRIEELALQYYHQSEAYRALALELPGRYAQVCKEHRDILASLLKGDRENAERTSREHQLNTARIIAKSLGVDIEL
ncbi:MAG: GntR family transcriptional regulator [Spirochaetes bacterium]|nr:GntR family transcriptional regulator [Spirochaetota bacterium]